MRKVARLHVKPFDVLLALAPAFLGMLALFFPGALLHYGPPCVFSSVLGWEHCWGCGITHAIIALLHGDVAAAWQHNPRSLIVLPLLIVVYTRHLHGLLKRRERAIIKPVS